jgi:hypothetical protein
MDSRVQLYPAVAAGGAGAISLREIFFNPPVFIT